MIDETAGTGERSGAPEETTETAGAGGRVAFCQECGRELTSATVRRAGAAVFCEPCLVARLGGTPGTGAETAPGAAAGQTGWTTVGSTGAPQGAGAAPVGGGPAYPGGPATGEAPNPGLAALLGLIPGVGAFYNGQYAKGVAHLVIFAILVSLSDNVNGIFGLFVAGWVIYQSIEAYHTAKARLQGLPLPNAFGLNDIGDRMGFGRNWPGSAARPVTTAPPGGWSAGTTAGAAQQPAGATGWTAGAAGWNAGAAGWNPGAAANWAGYVPPTHFGATAAPPPEAATAAPPAGAPGSAQAAGWTASTPPSYGPAYTGEPWQATGGAAAGVAGGQPVNTIPVRRFPAGAVWLIGLGLLFLLSNLHAPWRLGGSWLTAILLAALAVWLIFRRVEMLRGLARLSGEEYGLGPDGGRRLIGQMRTPVVLLVIAALFALQAAGVWTLGQTWPVLFIAWGAALVMERSLGQNTWYPAASVPAASAPAAANPNPAGYPRATWTASESETRKDGQ